MNKVLKTSLSFIITVLLFCVFISLTSITVMAEGSADLIETSNGKGYRPYLEGYSESSPDKTVGLRRQTQISVYAKATETIYFGSSALGTGAITMVDPNGIPHKYNVTTTSSGYISNLAQEGNGPDRTSSGVGYKPIEIVVPKEGIYTFTFYSSQNDDGKTNPTNNPTKTPVTNEFSGTGVKGKNSAIAAWDITVENSSGEIITGRSFSNALFLNIGAIDAELNTQVYILTNDGFVYKFDTNGSNLFGFIMYANSRGPLYKYVLGADTVVQSAYHSFLANDNSMSSINTASNPFEHVDGSIANVTPYNNKIDETFRLFFNLPDRDLMSYLGISPVTNLGDIVPGSFSFSGFSTNNAFISEGGMFSFKINTSICKATSFEVNMKLKNGSDTYYATLGNKIDKSKVEQNVFWNGLDDSGNIVPAGVYNDVSLTLTLKAGEMHIPMIDIETNKNGFKLFRERWNDVTKKYETVDTSVYYNNSLTTANRDIFVPIAPPPGQNPYLADEKNTTEHPVLSSNPDPAVKGFMAYTTLHGDSALLDFWTHATEDQVLDGKYIMNVVSDVTISKYDSDIAIDKRTNRDLLGGAEFKVYDEHSNILNFKKTADNIYEYSATEIPSTTTQVITSVAAEKLHLTKLPTSTTYTLEEIKAPDGYQLLASKTSLNVPIGNENFVITNDKITDYLVFEKYSSAVAVGDRTPTDLLGGARFTAKNASDETMYFSLSTDSFNKNIYVYEGTISDPSFTDTIETVQGYPTYVYKIPYGEVVFIETKAPDGYILNSGSIPVTVKGGKFSCLITNQPVSTLKIATYPVGSVENPLYNIPNAEYTIKNDSGEYCEVELIGGKYIYKGTTTDINKATLKSKSGEMITVLKLPTDIYCIEEITAPTNYLTTISNNESVSVEDGKITKIIFRNPVLTYNATVNVTNGIETGYTPTVTAGSTSFVVDTDPDSGYDLPTTIVVTMGGTTLT